MPPSSFGCDGRLIDLNLAGKRAGRVMFYRGIGRIAGNVAVVSFGPDQGWRQLSHHARVQQFAEKFKSRFRRTIPVLTSRQWYALSLNLAIWSSRNTRFCRIRYENSWQ